MIFIELEKMKDVIERVLFILDVEVESADKRLQTQSEEMPDVGLDAACEDLWVLQDLFAKDISSTLYLCLFFRYLKMKWSSFANALEIKARYQYLSETGRVEMVCLSVKKNSRNPFQ